MRSITERFLAAARQGNLQGLTELLAEDITLWADGGGIVVAAQRPVNGASKVAQFLLNIVRRAPTSRSAQLALVNVRVDDDADRLNFARRNLEAAHRRRRTRRPGQH